MVVLCLFLRFILFVEGDVLKGVCLYLIVEWVLVL